MSWNGSDRRQRLPGNWNMIRSSVLRRDGYRCQAGEPGDRCERRATDVDHITRGDDHDLSNLQALCKYHHGKKSAQEGSQAALAARARKASKFRREPEVHPSFL